MKLLPRLPQEFRRARLQHMVRQHHGPGHTDEGPVIGPGTGPGPTCIAVVRIHEPLGGEKPSCSEMVHKHVWSNWFRVGTFPMTIPGTRNNAERFVFTSFQPSATGSPNFSSQKRHINFTQSATLDDTLWSCFCRLAPSSSQRNPQLCALFGRSSTVTNT